MRLAQLWTRMNAKFWNSLLRKDVAKKVLCGPSHDLSERPELGTFTLKSAIYPIHTELKWSRDQVALWATSDGMDVVLVEKLPDSAFMTAGKYTFRNGVEFDLWRVVGAVHQ